MPCCSSFLERFTLLYRVTDYYCSVTLKLLGVHEHTIFVVLTVEQIFSYRILNWFASLYAHVSIWKETVFEFIVHCSACHFLVLRERLRNVVWAIFSKSANSSTDGFSWVTWLSQTTPLFPFFSPYVIFPSNSFTGMSNVLSTSGTVTPRCSWTSDKYCRDKRKKLISW